jgi:phage-related tail protein
MAEGSFDTILRAFVRDAVANQSDEVRDYMDETAARARVADANATTNSIKIDELKESIAELTIIARQNSHSIAALTAAVAQNTTEMQGLKAAVSANNEAIRESLQGAANAVPRMATQATASTTDRLVDRKLCM